MVLFRLMMPLQWGLLLLRDEVISHSMNSSRLFFGVVMFYSLVCVSVYVPTVPKSVA